MGVHDFERPLGLVFEAIDVDLDGDVIAGDGAG